jgi:dipeptidyl aminopeptidase/acylaminoacyl peptidase
MKYVRPVLTLAALLAATAGAAEGPLTPEQALSFVHAGDLNLSPDGSKLAYVEASYQWDWRPHLRVVEIATGTAELLTPQGKSDRFPRWSPDGRQLAFLSNRGGMGTQIYLRNASGGAPIALTSRANRVGAFSWSPDGRAIAYLARDDNAPAQDSGPQIADDERTLRRLWIVDLVSKATHAVGQGGYRIDEFQWQDASHLLVVATPSPRVEEFTDALYRVSIAPDGLYQRVSKPPAPFDGLVVSPDGKRYAVRSTAAQGPNPRDLFVSPTGEDALTDTSASLGLAVSDVKWRKPSTIWMRVLDGFTNRIAHASPAESAPVIDKLSLSVAAFDVSDSGLVAFAGEDFDHAEEIYLRTQDGRVRQLGHLQQGWDNSRLLSSSIFKTRSFDGTLIEAALLKPSPVPAGKLPLVLLVHGGPDNNFTAGVYWETAWARLLVSRGYAVLMVNPRGSRGYSEEFLKANRGDWGGGDYKDLIAVLDAVIAQGNVDPDRLGIGGWSYGGEMSAWAITQTNRFKAAVVGACVYDQQAEFETESDPAEDEWYFGTPWEHPEVFARNSPATHIGNAHTPALILDGQDDTNNPVGQSKGLYRALKHLGVDTQMVLYPDEGHSPVTGSYNVDMFTRIADWYGRYLK